MDRASRGEQITITRAGKPVASLRPLDVNALAADVLLSDYVKQDLEAAASQPTLEEIDARVAARGRSALRAATVISALRDIRDA